jgi:hypothetical protein
MQNRLKKRCTRCGVVREVRARQRRCHARRFGPKSYCCWGTLVKVERAKRVRKEAPMKTQASTENATRRPQDAAQKKLEQARKKVSEKTRAMARLATQLRAWERKATYYAKRASMTDAEILAEKAARVEAIANRKPKRRGIRVQRVDLTAAANGGTR